MRQANTIFGESWPKTPYAVGVASGKTYFWCACGKSQSQPYGDGSHKDARLTPLKFTAEEMALRLQAIGGQALP